MQRCTVIQQAVLIGRKHVALGSPGRRRTDTTMSTSLARAGRDKTLRSVLMKFQFKYRKAARKATPPTSQGQRPLWKSRNYSPMGRKGPQRWLKEPEELGFFRQMQAWSSTTTYPSGTQRCRPAPHAPASCPGCLSRRDAGKLGPSPCWSCRIHSASQRFTGASAAPSQELPPASASAQLQAESTTSLGLTVTICVDKRNRYLGFDSLCQHPRYETTCARIEVLFSVFLPALEYFKEYCSNNIKRLCSLRFALLHPALQPVTQ